MGKDSVWVFENMVLKKHSYSCQDWLVFTYVYLNLISSVANGKSLSIVSAKLMYRL